ncbi:hypothetical protein CA13_62470 [Planctomycetes bacterium CA13]|uniref:Pilus formation protein N-terminal domain-containing protein n=1 Tax=Novipirellula herctigrandis TaxID=2527986 RepID=A0A5C5ZC82_9BACT|nr:hypothetical protein CA13_62470 [Planctomycetes bacterium CA13]
MKQILSIVMLAGLTGIVFATDPPTEEKDDDGNRSWSQSYSHSWGDAPPTSNWGQMAPNLQPPTNMGPVVPPNLNQGFYPGWNMPMQGFPNQSFSSSSHTNSMSISGTSVLSSLANLQLSTGTKIRITEEASALLSSSTRKVTLSEVNKTPIELAAIILEGTDCTASKIDNQLIITAEGERLRKNQLDSATKSLSKLIVAMAMERPITLTMQQTPLPFVVQMLQGMSGVRIELPTENRSFFYTPQPMVSVDANRTPLGDVLVSIAEQINATIEVEGGVIELRSKKLQER